MKNHFELKKRDVHAPHKPTRLAIALTALRMRGWRGPLGMLSASAELRVEERELRFADLPSALDGFTLGYASDIHFGAMLDEGRVEDWAARMNALDADVILLGGDYGDDAAASLRFFTCCPPLKAREGVWGVWGNHDRAEGDLNTLCAAMSGNGIIPLVNECAIIRRGASTLALCGADDYLYGQSDLKLLAHAARAADFAVLAVHEPDAAYDPLLREEEPFCRLMLCGHTHGGQVTLAGLAPKTSSMYGWRVGIRYLSGWYPLGEKACILVSNGVGTTALPLRLGAPAQIHRICLRRGRMQEQE